ncbi:MAG: Gldg family protein, partial [Candidatus Omnitrophica bacterium]|nr:Gldg family protein [Candidatus Omnitrophota bacterium]
MAHIGTIFWREIAAYFNAAIAYIFMIVFVLLNGGLFMTNFFLIGDADMRAFFFTLPFVLSVFLPAVTMRLWAEERRGYTLELLLTFPMRTEELVLGKFLASFVFYLSALCATFPIVLMLHVLGRPDTGAIFAAYVGSALIGAFFLGIGIFISGLCRDQIVAFILAMIICFGLYLIGTEFLAVTIDGWIPGLGTFLQEFIGSAPHFQSFAKGVIDNRDVLYFVAGAAIFLVLNGFWLEGRMRPKAKTIFTSAVVISAGIFLMGNWFISSLPIGRFDLTEGKVYTMSGATQKILQGLKAPVTAKLYISPSEKMPTGMKTLERDVVDKLNEFRMVSNGKFQYKIFHMEAANVMEDRKRGSEESLEGQLSRKGIEPFQVQSIEADEVGVNLVYSAISLVYKEKPEEMIPRLMPANLPELEYLLISKIYRMMLPEIPKVAMVAPYEDRAMDPQLQALFSQLGARLPGQYREDDYEILSMAMTYEGYDVSRISLSEEEPIPGKVKTLVILEPRQFTERQKFEINRFLRGGGSLFLAVQNYEYDYRPVGGRLEIFPVEKKPEINSLLSAWGFEVDEDILADRQSEPVTISSGAMLGPFAMSVPVKLPTQMIVTPSEMNPGISITSRLSSLFYLWGTAIKINDQKIKEQNLKVETLFESSRQSWTVPFIPWSLTPQALEKTSSSRKGPFPLAVM